LRICVHSQICILFLTQTTFMNLNNLNQIKKLDKDLLVAKSIEQLPDQIRQVLNESRKIKIPFSFTRSTPTFSKRITQVVVNGMGGSNIGARIIKSVFSNQLKVPLNIEPGYEVPAYVNRNTLYIISSYSGTTEEPLSTYQETKKRNARILGITMDSPKSKLAKLMRQEKLSGYIFNPLHNPSQQPRLGLGYSVFGITTLLAKAGLIKIDTAEIKDIISKLEITSRRLRPESKTSSAKIIAQKLVSKHPTLVGAEFLIGNVKALRNQMSENSKQIPGYLTIPDLNHFAMEGLAFPGSRKSNSIWLFFDSKLYHPRVQKRSLLTKQIVKKNGISVIAHELKSKTKLAQAFEMLQLGTWITYYLGILNNINPRDIPWVNWFKKQLK